MHIWEFKMFNFTKIAVAIRMHFYPTQWWSTSKNNKLLLVKLAPALPGGLKANANILQYFSNIHIVLLYVAFIDGPFNPIQFMNYTLFVQIMFMNANTNCYELEMLTSVDDRFNCIKKVKYHSWFWILYQL